VIGYRRAGRVEDRNACQDRLGTTIIGPGSFESRTATFDSAVATSTHSPPDPLELAELLTQTRRSWSRTRGVSWPWGTATSLSGRRAPAGRATRRLGSARHPGCRVAERTRAIRPHGSGPVNPYGLTFDNVAAEVRAGWTCGPNLGGSFTNRGPVAAIVVPPGEDPARRVSRSSRWDGNFR
jgi:hypothetical protein